MKQLRAVPLSGNQEFDTDNGKKAIRIEISSASFTNMGSLRRSRKTVLNANRVRIRWLCEWRWPRFLALSVLRLELIVN